MKITIEVLDAELRKHLDSGEPLLLSFVVPDQKTKSTTRKKRIQMQKAFIHPPEEQQIIDAWNDSDYITLVSSGQISDSRNCRVTTEDLVQVTSVLKRGLREVGSEEILRSMKLYFQCCSQQGHVWDRANHGFKHLGGFLQKLISCNKEKRKPWWEKNFSSTELTSYAVVEDCDPELTALVANMFAKQFFGTEDHSYSSREYAMFIKVAAIVKKVSDSRALPFADPTRFLVEYIMKCAAIVYQSEQSIVYPKNLLSRSFWTISLPQYLSENLGIPSEAISQLVGIAGRNIE